MQSVFSHYSSLDFSRCFTLGLISNFQVTAQVRNERAIVQKEATIGSLELHRGHTYSKDHQVRRPHDLRGQDLVLQGRFLFIF